jgi:hypothetical protein
MTSVVVFFALIEIAWSQGVTSLDKRLEAIDARFDSSKQKADDAYRDQIIAISEVRLSELKGLMTEYTKSGDLDGAIQIRDRVQATEAEANSNNLPAPFVTDKLKRFVSRISRMYWVPPAGAATWFPNGPNGIVFRSDGFVVPVENAHTFEKRSSHRWAAIDDDRIVVMHTLGYLDVFTVLKNDVLHCDHYGKNDGHDHLDFRANLLPVPKRAGK